MELHEDSSLNSKALLLNKLIFRNVNLKLVFQLYYPLQFHSSKQIYLRTSVTKLTKKKENKQKFPELLGPLPIHKTL